MHKVHAKGVNILSHSFAKTLNNVMRLAFQSVYLMDDLVNTNINKKY